jgi:hypothetical protein
MAEKTVSAKLKQESIKNILAADGIVASIPQLEELVNHVDKHEYFLGKKVKFHFTWHEALFSWYENIYKPIREYILNSVVLFAFPSCKPHKRLDFQLSIDHFLQGEKQMDLYFKISHEWYMISVLNEVGNKPEAYPIDAVRNAILFHSKLPKIVRRLLTYLI